MENVQPFLQQRCEWYHILASVLGFWVLRIGRLVLTGGSISMVLLPVLEEKEIIRGDSLHIRDIVRDVLNIDNEWQKASLPRTVSHLFARNVDLDSPTLFLWMRKR